MPQLVFDRKLDQIRSVMDRQVFFLCGVMKSGTTWLERLLDNHEEIVCKGEAHFGSNVIRPISQLVENYNKDIPTRGGAVVHLKQFGGNTEVLQFDEEDIQFLATTAIASMFTKWIVPGTRCIGDKTPGNLDDMPVLGHLFPDAKFIHIIRDGRDVAVSLWHFNLNTNIVATIKKWGTFENFCLEFAGDWAARVQKGRQTGSTIGSTRYIEVLYEDLLSDPLPELSRVFDCLGVDNSTETVVASLEACSFEKLSGGRNRGEEDRSSFFRKGIANDWKEQIRGDSLAAFIRDAGPALTEFGYSLD